MKLLILIVLLTSALCGCAAQMDTKWGQITFHLTPEIVEQLYAMATRNPQSATRGVSQITTADGQTITMTDDPDALEAWGSDGVLTRSEVIYLKVVKDKFGSDFVFENRQKHLFLIKKGNDNG